MSETNPDVYRPSNDHSGINASKYNTSVSVDQPSPLQMTRKSSVDRAADRYKYPQHTSKSIDVTRSLRPANGTASGGGGAGLGDSKWNSGIDARLEQADADANDGADDAVPELYMQKQRSKRLRRQSEGGVRPMTAPSTGLRRSTREYEASGLTKAREEEWKRGEALVAKWPGFREKVRSLAERQSRARYASEDMDRGKSKDRKNNRE